jgi:hypothetical protein
MVVMDATGEMNEWSSHTGGQERSRTAVLGLRATTFAGGG